MSLLFKGSLMNMPGFTLYGLLKQVSKVKTIEINPGIYLDTQANIISEQQSWSHEDPWSRIDFTGAPFWLTTQCGYIEAIHNPSDLIDLIDRPTLQNLFIERVRH